MTNVFMITICTIFKSQWIIYKYQQSGSLTNSSKKNSCTLYKKQGLFAQYYKVLLSAQWYNWQLVTISVIFIYERASIESYTDFSYLRIRKLRLMQKYRQGFNVYSNHFWEYFYLVKWWRKIHTLQVWFQLISVERPVQYLTTM